MATVFDVLFTPAECAALPQRDLSGTICVVFDILRATTTMMTALANGAEAIIPVAEIAEALALRQQRAELLLAGEREGLRIRAAQTGGVDFDLGNSPREFTPEKVRGKTIVMTTTNGTRALRACAGAKTVLIGSFLNLRAVAGWLQRERRAEVLLVCSGTHEEAAYEDTLAAGALCELICSSAAAGQGSDAVAMARQIYRAAREDLLTAMQHSRNARRLLAISELREDVSVCLRRDTLEFVAELDSTGAVRKLNA